jgi:hypothetical protein
LELQAPSQHTLPFCAFTNPNASADNNYVAAIDSYNHSFFHVMKKNIISFKGKKDSSSRRRQKIFMATVN